MSKQNTKIIQKVSQHSDLNKIAEITEEIIGKTCWNAHIGYGEELKLDIGGRIPRKVVRDRGEWMLGSRGTDWMLARKDEIIVSSKEKPEIMEREIQVILHSPILSFVALYPGLGAQITFANECVLSITPKKEDDEFEVAYWELFTPYEMLLEVGYGLRWSYTSVHDPV